MTSSVVTHLAPALLMPDLNFVFEVDDQLILSRQCPLQSSSIRSRIF